MSGLEKSARQLAIEELLCDALEGNPVQMLHEPNNRAMWHTNCESQFSSPMRPVSGGEWECARCGARTAYSISQKEEPTHG
jgi:hypothetical protein